MCLIFSTVGSAGRLQGVVDHRHPIHSPKPCAQAGAVHAAAAGHGKGGSGAAAVTVRTQGVRCQPVRYVYYTTTLGYGVCVFIYIYVLLYYYTDLSRCFGAAKYPNTPAAHAAFV